MSRITLNEFIQAVKKFLINKNDFFLNIILEFKFDFIRFE